MTDNNKGYTNRRYFIRSSALFAVAVTMPSFLSCKDGDDNKLEGEGCKTTEDILGPFYIPNAPFREDITPEGSAGVPLVISGKVLTNCDVPLKDAIVEIWNANDGGDYDSSDEYLFRGRYKTLEDGIYRFKSIIPGRYLNGNTYRPSHIHFKITAPGHLDLVSQIYFKDDPYIASDPWASAAKARERILMVGEDANGIDMVNFDIQLSKS